MIKLLWACACIFAYNFAMGDITHWPNPDFVDPTKRIKLWLMILIHHLNPLLNLQETSLDFADNRIIWFSI